MSRPTDLLDRPIRLSVVVPSFRRAEPLSRCLVGLAHQDRVPDEVIVVVRSDDVATLDVVRAAAWSPVRAVEVEVPGLLPAMHAGAGAATGDVIAFTDDDAIPRPDWVRRLENHFAEPDVGAVGGRDVIPDELVGETVDVGRITPWGRLVGNHHLAIGRARPVDVLKGVNIAFRRAALALPHDLRGRGSQVHWEVTMCAWARARGWQVIFDPEVIVDHLPAPRPTGDQRFGRPSQDVRDAAFNLVFGIASFYPELVWRRAAFGLLVGDRMTPGLLRAAIGTARGESEVGRVVPACLRGQVEALAALARGQRQRMVPVDAENATPKEDLLQPIRTRQRPGHVRDDLEPNKLAEISTARESLERGEPHSFRKPFGSPWGSEPFLKWATIGYAFEQLGVAGDAEVLDLGCGEGWTSLFLAESGLRPTGVDLAPARIEMAVARAARWGVDATFETGDMDELDLDRQFDAVLVYDALHHSARQRAVVCNVAKHLRHGGWVLFGEPSWLHGISPDARRVTRELGWIERGIGVRRLRRDCVAAGLGDFRRFFEPTGPYESRICGFGWQALRLVAADIAVAPQASVWLAARRP